MPERVLLQPAPLEYGLHREQYDALVRDLEAEGVLVRVVPAVEERGIPPGVSGDFYDLIIHVGAVAGAIVSTAKLVEIVRRMLRRRESPSVELARAKIYLDNGAECEFTYREDDG